MPLLASVSNPRNNHHQHEYFQDPLHLLHGHCCLVSKIDCGLLNKFCNYFVIFRAAAVLTEAEREVLEKFAADEDRVAAVKRGCGVQ